MGRFAAIAIISLLGAGVYGGLRMSAPDMRIAGDEYFDATNFYDVGMVSTIGFDGDSLKTISGIEGVGEVMATYEADAMVRIGESSYAASIESLPLESARASDTSDGVHAVSDDPAYLNRPILVEGQWPADETECVVFSEAADSMDISLGDAIEVEKTTADIEDVFARTSFTVAGFVDSPAYVATSLLGTTSLGTGSIELYAYVSPKAFAGDYPYTFVYATVPAAAGESWGTAGYDAAVSDVKQRLHGAAGSIGDARRAAVKSEAQEELDEERAKYERERDDALRKLEDAADELASARNEIGSGYNDLVSGKAELDDAAATIDSGAQELSDGEAQYREGLAEYESGRVDALKQLDDAQAEIDAGRAQLAAQSPSLDELKGTKKQVEEGIAQIDEAEKTLSDTIAGLEKNKADLDKAIAELDEAIPQLEGLIAAYSGQPGYEAAVAEYQAKLVEAKAGLSEAQAGLAQVQAGLAEANAKLAALPAQRAQLEANLKQVDDGIAQMEAAQAELDAGQAELDAQRKAALAKLDAAKAELDAARAQLDDGWAQLGEGVDQYNAGVAEYNDGTTEFADGVAEYNDGLAEYEENRVKAENEFADAEKELADAQKKIDDIEEPDVFVMDRTKNPGAASLDSDADGIAQIASLFPFMFFLVAALVSLTSMTRMVDEERMTIGTHKALGYGKARITSKYLIYGVLASGVGSVLGIVTLGKLLPLFIMTAYGITYAVPVFPTPLEPATTFKALGLSIGVTAAATLGAAASSLREKPAALMLPRVPRAGKRIFLERITPLWSRMSFSRKVTARNLLRYKRRFFMAVVGIAGCTALLMVGFGLRDAIGGIVSNQYEELINYDAVVRMDEDDVDEQRDSVIGALRESDVESYLLVNDFNLIAHGPGDDLRIEVIVPSDPSELSEFVTLRDRETGAGISPDGTDIVLTEKAASVLGARVGDTVELYEENLVGDAKGSPRTFTVGGIAENYLGHYAYLMPDGYRAAFGEEPDSSLAYVKLADGADAAAFSDRLLSNEGVNTVSFVADKIVTYEGMLDVMNKLIYIIVLLAAALAFVVLYNLTNINISERVREIATLKVLGFTRGEVNAYIFREIAVMALIGALIGCVLGVPLTGYIAQAAETPQMMFGRSIEPASFVFSFLLTVVFSVIVALTMRGKLARVNMVESLKSVE